MTLSVWLYSQCFSLLALLLLEHYLLSILTLSNPAASGTLFAININLILSCSCWNIIYHQFLAGLTLLLLGYYLPFIINLYSHVISEFWCFLIMNMEDGESGAWSVPLLFYTERKWSCAYFSLFKYWRWFKYLHSCRKPWVYCTLLLSMRVKVSITNCCNILLIT